MKLFSSLSGKHILLVFVLFLSIAFLIYSPGIKDFWLLDDFSNIVKMPQVQIDEPSVESLTDVAASGIAGPLKRPVATISFALNYYYSGLDAAAFKIVNVAIHAVNGVLLFIFLFVLLQQCRSLVPSHEWLEPGRVTGIAFFVSLLWLVHPYNLTSVLYVVQRMNSLAFLFMCLAGISWMKMRWAMIQGQAFWQWLLLVVVALLIGLLSKENSIVIALFFLVLELMLYQFRSQPVILGNILKGLFVFSFIAGVALSITYFDDVVVRGYAARGYTPVERLLSESRIIWVYLGHIVLPDLGRMFLFHDNYLVSRGLLEPPVTLLAILSIAALLLFAIGYRKKNLPVSLGILLFFSAHLLESTVLPLKLYFEHRNYFPMTGILLSLTCLAAGFYFNHEFHRRKVMLVVVCLVPLLFALTTVQRSLSWSGKGIWVSHELKRKPESPALNYESGLYYYKQALDIGKSAGIQAAQEPVARARHYFEQSLEFDEDFLLGYVGQLRLDDQFSGTFDEELFDAFVTKIGTLPVSSVDSIIIVNEIAGCTITRRCHFPPEKVLELLYALESRPSLKEEARLSLKNNIASMLLMAGRNDEALQYVLDLLENTDPALNEHQHYLTWLILVEIEGRTGNIVHYYRLRPGHKDSLSGEYWEKLDAKAERFKTEPVERDSLHE